MFTISCYIGLRCGGTRLYIICVESDYTCAQMNQGWRPIHVDIHISLNFHLCSMPNLIYEYYAASSLYRTKLYVIRIIIIFHICATLPSPELHLTEMVCFQCFVCLHVFSCDQAALQMVFSVCLFVRPSVRLSVCLSVRPSHLFDYVPIILSSWNFQELLPVTEVTSLQKVKVRSQRSRSQRSQPNFTVSGL